MSAAQKMCFPVFSCDILDAFSLQCNTCHGEYDCLGENVTCEDPSASCSTSVRKAYVGFLEFQSVRKGCAPQLFPHESISLNSHLMSLSYQARYCAEDGCNNETYFVSHPAPVNHMRCHSCATQGAWCPEASRTQISCAGDQDQCLDLAVTGKLGPYDNMKMKGCTNLPRCQETLSFHSADRTIHASCCSTALCNTFNPDLHVQSQATNGLECYSCVDDNGSGSGCSKKSISKVQCTGIHNMCLEGIGNSRKAGRDLGLVTFKGCASPAMCQSSLLALVQELDNADVMCCQGNLCNDRIVDGVVTQRIVPADSADTTTVAECATPTPSGTAPNPDCIYDDEDEDSAMVAHVPAGADLSPGSHVDNETAHKVNEKEGSESLVNEGDRNHSTTAGEHVVNENIVGDHTEGHTVSPAGNTDSEDMAVGSSSAATNLDESNAGTNATSSGNHGSVVVLVPVVVPKKNATSATATTTSSSSSETSGGNMVVVASNDDEECEAEEEAVSTGQQFMTGKEANREDSAATHPSGVFYESETRPHGSAHSPATGTTGNTNVDHTGHATTSSETFAVGGNHGDASGEHVTVDGSTPQPGHATSGSTTGGKVEAGAPVVITANAPAATSSPDGAVLVSGAAAGTPRPKKKIPCKRPGPQSRPGVNLASAPGAESRGVEDTATKNPEPSLFSDAKQPELNAGGKGSLDNGALGVVSNLGLFCFTLLLAALLH
ncbi:uncharacterized protein LOC114603058 [Podarcis muralis]